MEVAIFLTDQRMNIPSKEVTVNNLSCLIYMSTINSEATVTATVKRIQVNLMESRQLR
jgi:hypothetical protein